MRKRLLSCAVFALACSASDWLSSRGDPQGTGWQKQGRSINPGNAPKLKLLWKLRLDNQSKGLNSLTALAMLGPIVTHRGIKELVFVAGSDDNLFAVDADRGRLFWSRHIPISAAPQTDAKWPCGAGLTAAPAIGPPPLGAKAPRNKVRTEDDDEGGTPLRPFYFVSSDGVLHTIRPSDGVDMAPPRSFVPANANMSALNLAGRFLYAKTSGGCAGVPDGVWGMDTSDPASKVSFASAASDSLAANLGVSVGSDGAVYSSSSFPGSRIAPIPLTWRGRELLIAAGAEGRVLLFDAGARREKPLAATASLREGEVAGIATSVDSAGSRWIYAAFQGPTAGIVALRVPTLARAWSFEHLASPLAPVVFNGVLLVLDAGRQTSHATLYALDAQTGKQLYSSGDAVTSFVHSSRLAVANGHICFGASDNTLYCFGFPIEI